jgi:hypothetical protein
MVHLHWVHVAYALALLDDPVRAECVQSALDVHELRPTLRGDRTG